MPAEQRLRTLTLRLPEDTAEQVGRLAQSLTNQGAAPFIASVIEQLRPQIDRVIEAAETGQALGLPPLAGWLVTLAEGIEPRKPGAKPRKPRAQPDGQACTAKEDAA